MSEVEFKFAALVIPGGVEMESQSGLQLKNPRVYGALACMPGNELGAIIIHPSSNFMGHYLLAPLARAGVDVLGLNTRYVNNDSTLIMERAILDLGAGVKYMRERGYKRLVLIGNSGGGGLVSFYQAQAERPNITHTPAGDPISLCAEDLPPADGIVLAAAHLGRPQLLQGLIDPSILNETDPLTADPGLDMYLAVNGPPYSSEFLTCYRASQSERMRTITEWAKKRLRFVRESGFANDEAFIVYRTYADPRYVDLSIDPNDRRAGGDRGANSRKTNYGPNTLARFSTLTSWLSQWSLDSHALGPDNLARTTVPVLQFEYTADASVFPNAVRAWSDAAADRVTTVKLNGASHYLTNQPVLLEQLVTTFREWANV